MRRNRERQAATIDNRQGNEVIVVALAAASWGVRNHIKTDLRGLKYTFAEQGLLESPKFAKRAESLVEEALAAR